MKNLFAIAAVAAMLVACGGNTTCENKTEAPACCQDSTKACCQDSTKACCQDSTAAATDSAAVAAPAAQ